MAPRRFMVIAYFATIAVVATALGALTDHWGSSLGLAVGVAYATLFAVDGWWRRNRPPSADRTPFDYKDPESYR